MPYRSRQTLLALLVPLLVPLLLAISGPVRAQEEPLPEVRRRAVAEFSLQPKGEIVVRVRDASGTAPLPVDGATLRAIGDNHAAGRTVAAGLHRTGPATFAGELALPDGQWNLDLRVEVGGERLEGSFLFRPGEAVITGQFPLAPPNPEVGRIGRLVTLMLGVPVALAVLIGLWAVLARSRATARAEEAADRA